MNISLITVTFNAGHTIARTLESVACQDCNDFEHIIIDGKSTDDTLQIIEKYKADNPHLKIVVVSEPDKGLYDAMNKGLALAKGQFVCFLNAGDKLHHYSTLTTINGIIEAKTKEGNEPAVVYGETDIVDDEGKFISHRRHKAPDRLTWKSFKNGMLVCHQSFYANRSVTTDYDLTYRFSADFDWCVKAMKTAESKNMPIINSNAILTDYLSEGMTTKNHKESLKERFHIMSKHYGWFTTVICHIKFLIKAPFK